MVHLGLFRVLDLLQGKWLHHQRLFLLSLFPKQPDSIVSVNALHMNSLLPVYWTYQMALVVKNLPANAGDVRDSSSIPGLGRSPGGGHGKSLQCSYLENPHGPRSLVGYSPWGRKELDMPEQLSTHTTA